MFLDAMTSFLCTCMIFWLFENPDVLRQYMFCMALPCMLSTEFTSKSCMMLGFQNEGRLRRERGPAGDPQLRIPSPTQPAFMENDEGRKINLDVVESGYWIPSHAIGGFSVSSACTACYIFATVF